MDGTMKNANFLLLILLIFFLGAFCVTCTSIDVQNSVAKQNPKKSGKVGKNTAEGIITVPIDSEPVIIEVPIYIPAAQGSPAPAPPRGKAAVDKSNEQGIVKPQDYSHAAMIYDYDNDLVYEVYCQPLRVTDLYLRPGERVSEPPFVSDSDRWLIGAGVSYEENVSIQHIYVKPTAPNLVASLIINTNERVYHLILRSYSDVHMPMVRWRYPSRAMPEQYARGGNNSFTKTPSLDADDDTSFMMADPRFISFNYRITYSLGKKPRWMPEFVYDDGSKTYITFPLHVLQTDLPAVFEDRADVVNYRVAGNVMIIDKLVTKLTIKIDNKFIVVEKKKGGK
jgi:type IV secretion system protein VirB9